MPWIIAEKTKKYISPYRPGKRSICWVLSR
jgi:hypothetical protein